MYIIYIYIICIQYLLCIIDMSGFKQRRLEGEAAAPEEVGEEEILAQTPAEARVLYLLLNDPESGGSQAFFQFLSISLSSDRCLLK